MPTPGHFDINDSLVLVGSKSLRITASAATFSIASTQSFGDLSAYTGVASGVPSGGTVGVWVYSAQDEISSVSLKIGSGAGAYLLVSGIRTYTDAWDTQDGWNYVVFRLSGGVATGTPDWTAVDYAVLTFVSTRSDATVVLDYFTIGKGNVIALNGWGRRATTYTDVTSTY